MTHHLTDIISQTLEKARSHGVCGADAVIFEQVELSTSERLGKPEGIERSESTGLGLRVFTGNKQAIVSSTDVSPIAIEELAERAVAMAKCAPPDPDNTLADTSLLCAQANDLDLYDDDEPSAKWLQQQCHEAESSALEVDGITNSEGADAGYSKSIICLGIADKNGVKFNQAYASSSFSLSASVLAGSGTSMERDYDYSSARHRGDLAPADRIGKKAAQLALKRLNPKKISTCKVPVVFDPRVGRSLLHIFANATSGSSIARKTSFLKEEMGNKIFSNNVHIIDNPHMKRGLGSKPFDGEGVKNQPMHMIKNGELQSWFLDTRTANKLGLTTTGHAARGLASGPSPSSSNLYIENGDITPEELMKDIKDGFYVTETFGMGVNIVTGDYSQGASGFWIENGQIAYPVSEITIAGKLADMFKTLTPANDLEFRYATNSPTFAVDGLTVAGT